MRLDNLVYRLGFADSRAQARQLVCHGHFAVNGRKTDIPSFIAKPNDVIAVRERSKGLEYFKTRALLLAQKGVPAWLSLDTNAMTGRVLSLPSRTELELPFEEQWWLNYISDNTFVHRVGGWEQACVVPLREPSPGLKLLDYQRFQFLVPCAIR